MDVLLILQQNKMNQNEVKKVQWKLVNSRKWFHLCIILHSPPLFDHELLLLHSPHKVRYLYKVVRIQSGQKTIQDDLWRRSIC